MLVARDGDHLEQVCVELNEDYPDIEALAFTADVSVAEDRLAVFDWVADLETPASLQQCRRQ